MLEVLDNIIKNFHSILENAIKDDSVKTMYIEYEEPFVSRVWFPFKEYRIYLHRIEVPTNKVFFHPHKWESAMLIAKGTYEMGIGHSTTNDEPKVDCRLLLNTGSKYEMCEKDAWHYVKPINDAVYTLMVTGKLNGREMPKEGPSEYRELTTDEFDDIISTIKSSL